MRKLRNVMLTAAIITVGTLGTLGTLGASSLFAQENALNEEVQTNGMQGHMMDEGGMHGKMMGQMHSMMEKCSGIMEMMQQKKQA